MSDRTPAFTTFNCLCQKEFNPDNSFGSY
ncbi:hypothetical protein ETSB_1428 [cyanobacterium endosymbiont of Epithemia turgida isolate EtSB Lake Yunoko]|nr:hypothetical protein ETSB_1428 [cyanobacterium endosymbiont of Epithemia turgida isolate EtSB Lake Yunoko]